MAGYEKKCKVVDGKIVAVNWVPTEMEKQRRRFMRDMDKQGAWMPEASFKQIIEAYNEAFSTRLSEI